MKEVKEIYCPKCHKLVAIVAENNNGKKVIQNGNVLINMPKGSTGNSLSVRCPDGHSVSITV